MQNLSDIAQNPAVAKTVPIITAGTGLATATEWFPLVAGALASLVGLMASVMIIYVNWTQHKIKIKILKSELHEITTRDGRYDRHDD